MWLLDRRYSSRASKVAKIQPGATRNSRFAIPLLLCFSACGFHPEYGDDSIAGKDNPMRGNVAIENIPSHEGQMLKTYLEDKFNPEGLNPKSAEYRLVISLNKALAPTVVKSDGTIQRYDVRFSSDFKLFKASNPVAIYSGKLRRIGSYNVAINANFATYEAEQDVIERTLNELAEDYVLRIGGYLATDPKVAPLPHAAPSAKPLAMTPTPPSFLQIAPAQPLP